MKRSRLLSLLLPALLASCSSGQPPRPQPPGDPVIADLTAWLRLDPVQQQRTKQLLAELDERNAEIRGRWEKAGRVRPEELLVSRSIFERDFLAILTEEQKRLYSEVKSRLAAPQAQRPYGR